LQVEVEIELEEFIVHYKYFTLYTESVSFVASWFYTMVIEFKGLHWFRKLL